MLLFAFCFQLVLSMRDDFKLVVVSPFSVQRLPCVAIQHIHECAGFLFHQAGPGVGYFICSFYLVAMKLQDVVNISYFAVSCNLCS